MELKGIIFKGSRPTARLLMQTSGLTAPAPASHLLNRLSPMILFTTSSFIVLLTGTRCEPISKSLSSMEPTLSGATTYDL